MGDLFVGSVPPDPHSIGVHVDQKLHRRRRLCRLCRRRFQRLFLQSVFYEAAAAVRQQVYHIPGAMALHSRRGAADLSL